jgi:hypothetical protein
LPKEIAVVLDAQPPTDQFVPALLWPGLVEDLESFPDQVSLRIRGRYEHADRPGLRAFVASVFEAQTRVWILDPFFGEDPLPNGLFEALAMCDAADLRFLTKSVPAKLSQDLRDERRDRRERFRGPTYGVSWYGGLRPDRFPFCHDRFAVIDGELWHFGGTVGGHQPGLTAVSRGWVAANKGVSSFFADVWRECERGTL